MEMFLRINDVERSVTFEPRGDDYVITVDGRQYVTSGASISSGVLNFFVGSKTYRAFVSKHALATQVTLNGRDYFYRTAEEEAVTGTTHHGDGTVEAPMPGNIIAVNVKPGDRVQAGDSLVIIESMKMQNEITSPISGEVHVVNCATGDQVAFGKLLVQVVAPKK